MNHLHRILSAILVGVSLSACGADLKVAPGTQIKCSAPSDCPASYECNLDVGLCVPVSRERVPPSLTDITVSRTAIAAGIPVTIGFVASEELLSLPKVELANGNEARLPWGVTDDSDNAYTAVFAATGRETEGTWNAVASLLDLNGNAAVDIPLADITLDFHAPQILDITATPPAARAGDTVIIDVTVDEPLSTCDITLDGAAALTPETSTDPLVCRFSYYSDGSHPTGTASVQVHVTDLAGNMSELDRADFLVFDYGAPLLEQSEILTHAVRAGIAAGVSFSFSEPLSIDNPAVVELQRRDAGVPVGPALPMTLDVVNGTNYVFTRTIVAGDADGIYDVDLVSFRDVAFNEGTPATVGTLRIDNTPPSVTAIQTAGGVVSSITGLRTYSAVAGFDTITVAFDVDENLTDNADPADNGVLTVALDGTAFTCSPFQVGSPSYSCTAPVASGTSGRRAIAITARDAVDNVTTLEAAMGLDFDPPSLYAGTPGRAAYKGGEIALYAVELSEPVDVATLTVTTRRDGTAVDGFFGDPEVSPSRASFTLHGKSPLAPADQGRYTIEVVAQDDVGNRSATLSDPSGGFTVDATAPVLTGVSVVSNNANFNTLAKDGDTVTATFSANEALSHNPTVLLGGLTMDLVSATGSSPTTYVYERRVATADGSGVRSVFVTAEDVAGNVGTLSFGSITLDFVAPAIATGSETVTLTPGTGNPLTSVSKVTFNTKAQVSFTATEPLLNDPNISLSPATGTWTIAKVSGVAGHYMYDITLTGGSPAQTTYSVIAALTDRAGNPSGSLALSLPAPGIVVDTVAPTPITTAQNDKVLFSRIPWGTNSTGGTASFTVATMPAQTGSVEPNCTVLVRDGSTAITGAELGRTVANSSGVFSMSLLRRDQSIVYLWQIDDAGNVDSIVGTALKNVEWTATMRSKVAGRSFENPNVYETRSYFAPYLEQSGEPGVIEQNGTAGMSESGGVLSSFGTGRWFNRSFLAVPSPRSNAVAVYDSARGKVVLFGGDYKTAALGETWEWDGSTWKLTDGSGPLPRTSHGMAYDAARGEVVLFGGTNSAGCGEGAGSYCAYTWTWDGNEWHNVATTGPSARAQHVMAYDSIRHRVVLFGGGASNVASRETWEWNGTAWTRVSTTGPSARMDAGMAFDPTRSGVVLFGGKTTSGVCDGGATAYCGVTWVWNGTAWASLTTTGTIVARANLGMAFDESRGQIVVMGGSVASGGNCNEGETYTENCGDVWALNGTTWQAVVTAGVVGRQSPALVYDAMSKKLLVFGGEVAGTLPGPNCQEGALDAQVCGNTWLLDGTTWRRPLLTPHLRSEGGMAYDIYRKAALLFGGYAAADCGEGADSYGAAMYCDDTWMWDGVAWTVAATTGPRGRHGPALAYFDAGSRPRVFMFGGLNDVVSCNEPAGNTLGWCGGSLWLWYDASNYWYEAATVGTAPARRRGAAAASFGTSGPTGALMFGGYNEIPWCSEPTTITDYRCGYTWYVTWSTADGAYRWSRPAVTEPVQRFVSAMAYKSDAPRVAVMFGGDLQAHSIADVEEWNGTTWNLRWDEAQPTRFGRDHHAMAYDSARQATVLFGGNNTSDDGVSSCESTGSGNCPGLWEWDGTAWTNRTVSGGPRRRQGHMMAFDTTRERTVLFGGMSDIGCGEGTGGDCGYTWELDGGKSARPAQTMSVYFGATGEDLSTAVIQSINADFAAGGLGRASATCSTDSAGSTLYVWDKGAWRSLPGVTQNSATPTSPAALSWSTTIDTDFSSLPAATFADRVQRLFFGRQAQSLNFAIAPTQLNGCRSTFAQVGVDYAEVRIRYRRN